MAESMSSRVGRVISGTIRQLVDSFENLAPEAVMENAVREIEGLIEDVRAEMGKQIASRHMTSKRLSHARSRHDELSEKIELAIREDREDLAQAAVSRQLDIEAQIPVLESAQRESNEKIKELESYVAALEARKREMEEELREFRQAKAESSGGTSEEEDSKLPNDFQSRLSRAESAFERVMERQAGLSGDMSDLKRNGQLAELENLARTHRIQERLAQARAKIKGGK